MKPAILTVSSAPQERGAEKIHVKYANCLKGFYSEVFSVLTSIDDIRNLREKIGKYPLIFVVVATGGTSDLIIEVAKYSRVVLLTHGKQNSLASALNATFKLKKNGKYVKIIHGLSPSSLKEIKYMSLVSEVVSQLKGTKIMLFCASKDWAKKTYNLEFLEKKLGMNINFVDLEDFLKDFEKMGDHREVVEKYSKFPCREITIEDIARASRVLTVIQDYLEKSGANICTIRCFPFLVKAKITPCLAISHLLDKGISSACEGDLSSLVMLEILRLLSGKAVFMGNVEDFQEDLILLAHCTVASTIVSKCEIRSHFETGYGVSIAGVFKEKEEVTVANFSPDLEEIFFTTGKIVKGFPVSEEFCRTQVQLKLRRSFIDFVEKAVNRHLCVVAGNFEKELERLAEFLKIKII